jgi:hypothetical protein
VHASEERETCRVDFLDLDGGDQQDLPWKLVKERLNSRDTIASTNTFRDRGIKNVRAAWTKGLRLDPFKKGRIVLLVGGDCVSVVEVVPNGTVCTTRFDAAGQAVVEHVEMAMVIGLLPADEEGADQYLKDNAAHFADLLLARGLVAARHALCREGGTYKREVACEPIRWETVVKQEIKCEASTKRGEEDVQQPPHAQDRMQSVAAACKRPKLESNPEDARHDINGVKKLHPMCTSTNQHPRAAPPVLVYGLACEQRYLDTKGSFADNERPTDLGTGSGRSSTGKSASHKRSRKESQGGAATKPRQKAADRTVAAAQAEDAPTLPQPKPRSASGYYGVGASKKRWEAYINYGGKKHSLGTFATKQEAALAYDREARKCGEEKPLNYESMERAEEAATKAQAEYALTLGPPQAKPRPASGYYGVSASKKRWAAQICYGGKHHFLGTFDTKQEAALGYDREARQCGEEKPLNYESMEGAEEAAKRAQAEYALTLGAPQAKPRPASGYYGVYASGKRWGAYIRYGGKHHNLGSFDTKQESAHA